MTGRRRSILSVPGSSIKMLEKAKKLDMDSVLLDLEDSVTPSMKAGARANVISTLNSGGLAGKIRSVRVNDWTSAWTYQDVVQLVEQAGASLDTIVLPKVENTEHICALDLLLTQIEKSFGLEIGKIGIDAQIESALGLTRVEKIAQSSKRMKSLIFGPADFMADIKMKSLAVGEQPTGYENGDAYHFAHMKILVAARAYGIQAIDGPYLNLHDAQFLRKLAVRARALGFDGKWVIHPNQITTVNEVFSGNKDEYEKATAIMEAYKFHSSAEGGNKGAANLDDAMIDEASRKMALVFLAERQEITNDAKK